MINKNKLVNAALKVYNEYCTETVGISAAVLYETLNDEKQPQEVVGAGLEYFKDLISKLHKAGHFPGFAPSRGRGVVRVSVEDEKQVAALTEEIDGLTFGSDKRALVKNSTSKADSLALNNLIKELGTLQIQSIQTQLQIHNIQAQVIQMMGV